MASTPGQALDLAFACEADFEGARVRRITV
jgi:hypothetical protein